MFAGSRLNRQRTGTDLYGVRAILPAFSTEYNPSPSTEGVFPVNLMAFAAVHSDVVEKRSGKAKTPPVATEPRSVLVFQGDRLSCLEGSFPNALRPGMSTRS